MSKSQEVCILIAMRIFRLQQYDYIVVRADAQSLFNAPL